jgi:hypothetical protein
MDSVEKGRENMSNSSLRVRFKSTLPLKCFASHMDSVLEQTVHMIENIIYTVISQSLPFVLFLQ